MNQKLKNEFGNLYGSQTLQNSQQHIGDRIKLNEQLYKDFFYKKKSKGENDSPMNLIRLESQLYPLALVLPPLPRASSPVKIREN